MTPEGKIAAYLTRRVRELGWEQRKVEWSGRRGAPDRFIMPPNGPSFWVELKAPGGKLKDHQAREINRMQNAGNLVFVAGSTSAIDELLESIDRIRVNQDRQ